MIPEAFFDCLQIASELSGPMAGVMRTDVQRIAFLSCLLSIYQAKPVSDWGYRFANTGNGVPFSDQLNDATARLLAAGHLVDTEGRLNITGSGLTMLATLSRLETMGNRVSCVSAAATSMLAVPLLTMKQGLEQEPTTVASHIRDGATMLLDEPHLQTLYGHFAALAQVIPPTDDDLLSPSVLWLSYMAQTKASEGTPHSSVEAA